jgi:hypothetical protein
MWESISHDVRRTPFRGYRPSRDPTVQLHRLARAECGPVRCRCNHWPRLCSIETVPSSHPRIGMRRAFIFITHLLSPRRSSVQVIHEDRCSNAHDPSVGNSHTCGLNGNAVGKRARVHECTAVVNEVSTKYPRMIFLTLLGAQGELDPQQRPRVAK